MGFYEEFAEKYDELVSYESRVKRESSFFKKLFSDNKSVLDCSCGTGQRVVMFDKMGLRAIGSDLSVEMIKKARKNAEKHDVKAVFKITNFMNLTDTFKEKFEAVICMGNSLPHLFSDRDLTKALSEMYKILEENGTLILQQRNYDKLTRLEKRFFPVSIRENEVFFYVLDYFPKKITFNVINLETKTKKFKVYSTEYNPIKKDHLAKLLRKAGFKNLKFYSDFEFTKFDKKNSDELIIVCKK